MLKETEDEEARFFVNFLSLVAFQLRGPRPPGPPPPPPSGYAYDYEIKLRS